MPGGERISAAGHLSMQNRLIPWSLPAGVRCYPPTGNVYGRSVSCMPSVRAVIFDLGGTLLAFPNWDTEMPLRWRATYRRLRVLGTPDLPPEERFIRAMVEAENEHWRRVDTEHWSGPPS